MISDNDGNIWFTDMYSVRKMDMNKLTVLSYAASNYGNLRNPKGIAVHGNTFFVADSPEHKITTWLFFAYSPLAGKSRWIGSDDGTFDKCSFSFPEALLLWDNDTLLVADLAGIRVLNLQTKMVSTPSNLKVQAKQLLKGNQGSLYALDFHNRIMKFENTWNQERLLWLGHLKEGTSCPLAGVPKDVIKELAGWLKACTVHTIK